MSSSSVWYVVLTQSSRETERRRAQNLVDKLQPLLHDLTSKLPIQDLPSQPGSSLAFRERHSCQAYVHFLVSPDRAFEYDSESNWKTLCLRCDCCALLVLLLLLLLLLTLARP